MKIYTYYEEIHHSYQQELLDLWKLSWKKSGFDPIVLSADHAKKHPFYEEFVKMLKYIHLQIMGEQISPYGLACYVRWLAYAAQDPEYCYVSDYDCINNGLEPKISQEKLHFMDDDCPCFASGKSTQFENLCHLFIDISLERIEALTISAKKHQHVCYHDQDFLVLNMNERYHNNAKLLLDKHNIMMTRDRHLGVGPIKLTTNNTLKVLHISYDNADNIKKENDIFSKMSIAQIRIELTKKMLNI